LIYIIASAKRYLSQDKTPRVSIGMKAMPARNTWASHERSGGFADAD